MILKSYRSSSGGEGEISPQTTKLLRKKKIAIDKCCQKNNWFRLDYLILAKGNEIL